MALFGKKNPQPTPQATPRDTRKAKRFFEHAATVADARNYDYALECYINGLKYDPENLNKHEALREVALKRKVAGGKPAPLGEKLRRVGRDPVERLMHLEMLWSKDPMNVSLMADVMAQAVETDAAVPELSLVELAYWVGETFLEVAVTGKKVSKDLIIKVRDMFHRIEAYDKAVDACQFALQRDPNNHQYLHDLKNLEAELTMQKSGYSEAAEQGKDFRETVKDTSQQRALEQDDALTQTEAAMDEIIARNRAAYLENPDDLDLLSKLASALARRETTETETEAIELLSGAWELTNEYRFKVQSGDIRMRQFNRHIRQLKSRSDADPEDKETAMKWRELLKDKLKFELQEYRERVKNYPTDMALRYELGRRFYAAKMYEEAISAFQQAKVHPKHRASSLEFLGRCYLSQGWFEEAIDTFKQGIEIHPIPDDRLGLELRYQLMRALKEEAVKTNSLEQAREAQTVGSQVLQSDINYREIRKEMEALRGLGEELRALKDELRGKK